MKTLTKLNHYHRLSVQILLLVNLIMVTSLGAWAKELSFKEIQNVKLPFEASEKYYEHTDDFKFFLCSTREEMLMLDGLSGKILWQTNFEKDFANKKFTNQFWNKDANVVLLFDEDTKKGVANKYFIDGASGKLLWKSDKYVSDFGQYELADGFQNYYDPETQGILLPTKDKVDFVNARSGEVIWSKAFEMAGKAKEFDCMILKYYDLVKVTTGKESEIYLTTTDGEEVTDITPFFNKKKYLTDRKYATTINIPEKNMYIIMQGEYNAKVGLLGVLAGVSMDIPRNKMNFIAYEEGTDKILWQKEYKIVFVWDWIDNSPYYKLFYADGKLYVEHDKMLKANGGLTVLDVDNGEKLWEAEYATSELDGKLGKTFLIPFPAPDPLVIGNRAYVVDKYKNRVACYDTENGKQIWETTKYPDAQKIPTLIAAGDHLILGYGGDAMRITYSTDKSSGYCASIRTENKLVKCSSGTMYIYKRGYNNNDKYGIIAYDINTGKTVWDGESIAKKVKDNFSYIAGIQLVGDKLYCATDKNFFILNPQNGDVVTSVPISKEKLGDTWKMYYFPENQKIILNCNEGIIKIDGKSASIEGTLKIKNIPYYPATFSMNTDRANLYRDYAIIIDGDPGKLKFDKFASIDLDNMVVRGSEDAGLLYGDVPHFSTNAEMFFKVDKGNFSIYKVK